MAKLVSKTYGDALFELALEQNAVDELSKEVQVVSEALRENEELMKLLEHPKIVKEEKLQIVENIFKGRVSDDLTGFLQLIVNKDRYGEIYAILDVFMNRVREYKHIGVASVTTAVELREEQKQAVIDKLLATTDYESFEMKYAVDAALIGGMVIRIGDRVVDSSIKHKLELMSRDLMKIQL
ncbi:MAG: F0F1 ATP synthase subunit delta [Lachnospiraceae bacterium]|nr:F0F1 ATP synthase subunit delta [Lachnospiraceae bacterium]